MSAMQLFGTKRQFLPASGILATPKLAVSLDDVHFPKPETFCNRATRRFFAVQNSAQVSAINAVVPCKGALTTLAFNCDSQQINNVIVVKDNCGAVSFRDGSDPCEFPFFDGRDFLSLSLLISPLLRSVPCSPFRLVPVAVAILPILLADFLAVLFTISPVVLAAPCAIFWSLLVLAVIFPPSLTVSPRSHGLDSPLISQSVSGPPDTDFLCECLFQSRSL